MLYYGRSSAKAIEYMVWRSLYPNICPYASIFLPLRRSPYIFPYVSIFFPLRSSRASDTTSHAYADSREFYDNDSPTHNYDRISSIHIFHRRSGNPLDDDAHEFHRISSYEYD